MKRPFLIAIVAIFVVLGIGISVLGMYAPQYHTGVLNIGNLIMAGLSVAAYLLVSRQMSGRPQAFVRGVSGASFLKLMVCMIAVLAYVLVNRSHIHKPTVFMLFGVYAVYSVVETILLSKIAKSDK